MAQSSAKYEKSKYKYVSKEMYIDHTYWKINVKGFTQKRYKSEKEAAIAVDKILIKQGKEPVNVLVKKL